MKYRVLIVEDDPLIRESVCDALASWGFEARAAADLSRVSDEARAFDPHLTLMDVSLPRYNGFYWCGEIRKFSRAPVVFLSSRADDMDVVTAMNMGGDDYIAKPVTMQVLLAKVQAMLRRAYDYQSAPPALTLGGWTLDPDGARLVKDADALPLTRNEQKILSLLLQKRGATVSRDEIMLALWDTDAFVDDNTLTVNMNRLRKKLAAVGIAGAIETLKGQGYIIREG